MPEAKKALDHQPKKAKPVDQVRTVTLDGHEYQIDPAVFDDLEFLELVEDEKWVSVLRLMLGKTQWAQFKENHADENGRVTGEKFAKVMEDFNASDLQGELGN